MLIAPTSTKSLQAFLPGTTPAAGSEGNLAYAGGTTTSPNPSNVPASEPKDTAEGARVTLTATRELQGSPPEFAPIYAEIWKNGMKVAEIDIYGGVNSINGLVAPAQGIVGGGGALLAARRAAEIVRSVGGEIRVGGQIMDGQTLDMRAKLKTVYGIA